MNRPWRQDGFADAYNPSKTIRRIELSAEATRAVFDLYDPTDEPAFALIEMDGLLRVADGKHQYLFQHLDNALRTMREENLIIFYAKTGCSYRMVWKEKQLPQRSEFNYSLEEVLLEPDMVALDDGRMLNNKTFRKIFRGFRV